MELATDEEKAQIDQWISDTITGDEAEFLRYQTYLMDAMEIMQKAAAGEQETTIAPYWRIRSGTADQHTSFTIGYNGGCYRLRTGGIRGHGGSDQPAQPVWKAAQQGTPEDRRLYQRAL